MLENNEISIEELIDMAINNIEEASMYNKFKSDNDKLAKSIYGRLFDFYCEDEFSGDVIFTWQSPSLVKDGVYIGKRNCVIENEIVIGNIFPNFKTNRKFSLNYNRNGVYGSFPHDYFDIYLAHVAKYAYGESISEIKEYYPLKRAICFENNMNYFRKFDGFHDFLARHYLEEIWVASKETAFSDMEFEEFKKTATNLMKNRGIQMLNKLRGN